MQKHILSKSTYMAGRQCLKRLYLKKFHRELQDEIAPGLQARFDAGHDVGALAQQLFPGGVDCSPEHYWDFGPSIEKTLENIHYGQRVIYEAAFQYEGVLAALDILVLKENGWYGYEVKSTNETKEEHILDAALQFWVMKRDAHRPHKMHIVHLNRDYVRQGELDVRQLFIIDDITEQVLELQQEVAETIREQKAMLESGLMPDIDIGPHCAAPYECDFMGHCWKHVPEYSVFDLTNPRGRQWDLYGRGILHIKDIPVDYDLTANQRIQVEGDKTGQRVIDKDGIREFLDGLAYPLYYLDFETIMPAVPLYDNSRPYQQVPFQYSLHVQGSPGTEPAHREFLADPEDGDPRRTLLEKMIPELGTSGDIIVYNASFETARLKEMAHDWPAYADAIEPLLGRIKDLMVPFMHKLYYAPEMKGRYSIKNVLPALVPELSYDGMDIAGGGEAMLVFEQLVRGTYAGDAEAARQALLEYCKLDTLGMVKLVEALQRQV